MPFARATGIGSTFDCADHSKSVCFFDSAIISSPLIVASISVAMHPSRSWWTPRRHEDTKTNLLLSFVASCLRGRSLMFQHLLAFRAEFISGLPLGDLLRLRDAVADGEQHHQVFTRPGEIPLRQHDVFRRVIAVRVPLVAHLLRVLRRLANEVDA